MNQDQLEVTKRNVRDAVVLFEHKEGSKLVDAKDIGALVRSLGVNPTGAQVTIIMDQLAALNAEQPNNSLLSIEHIEIVVANFLVHQKKALFRDDYHTLIRAFRALDQEGKGYVDAEHIRTLMSSRGEPMTEEEVSKMLGFSVNEDGKLFYVSADLLVYVHVSMCMPVLYVCAYVQMIGCMHVCVRVGGCGRVCSEVHVRTCMQGC